MKTTERTQVINATLNDVAFQQAPKTDYQGWKNRQTWNVALWINNDYNLYESAKFFMKGNERHKAPYGAFVKWCGLSGTTTPDRFKWDGDQLDYRALNEMMRELLTH